VIQPLLRKILIANRGEIACRVIRTAQRMGIKTVAVYSEADAEALHVRMADEAVAIGPAPSAQSYLDIGKIVAACRQTGAEAVHPGYGFLSENEDFPAALEKAGIVFIGPPARAIASMGDKIEAKRLAAAAGVAIVPGYDGVVASAADAVKIARKIKYPVMLKAAAGGGGKGMRVAAGDAQLKEGFRLASGEAKSAFGDARLFLEKYIEQPRHIEIQVLADARGNVVHLFERECSIQRRHQKVIEEAPSPLLDAKTRAAMGKAAVSLAKAVGYRSAGTVEFIVDRKKNFYFLEMNTRLQVEHPVTEMVTGLDLVELMIRVAAGESLPFTQDDLRLKGAAIEARLYAEDPRRDFLPSPGRLTRYAEPGGEGIRIDSGVYEGAEIALHYDPMIAKLAAFGDTRDLAAARLGAALDGFVIGGVSNNLDFLAAILRSDAFRKGKLSTAFIAREFPGGFAGVTPSPREAGEAVAAAAAMNLISLEKSARGAIPAAWVVILDGKPHAVETARKGSALIVTHGKWRHKVIASWRPGAALFQGEIDGAPASFRVERRSLGYRLARGGAVMNAQILLPRAAELLGRMRPKPAADLSRHLLSPMPGLLVSLAVREGQAVKAGEELAVIEAMKMENVLRAERDGKVKKLRAGPGDSLAVDQVILEFA
jgi:propionyl-CoA carboxylase alpha chain